MTFRGNDTRDFLVASILGGEPIDRVGDWQVCWKRYGGLLVVESSPSDGLGVFRTVVPEGCLLVLGEEVTE